MSGIIHSFQSLGAVDGPGLRCVVFLQGCTLRCAYCHNPDTWSTSGREFRVEEVFEKVTRFRPYFGKEGGVTVSGGEPLLQWEFVAELFRRLKAAGVHTALDTAGIGSLEGARAVLKFTDLVLCDLKFSTKEDYLRYSGADRNRVTNFLELTEEMGVPLWVRHVVVPGLTDGRDHILRIAADARKYSNFQKLELLPFHKICAAKYDQMKIPFPLRDFDECPQEKIEALYGLMNVPR
ncbi:pyruvate formate-lyase-activating protein [Caproiciproducens faecalis]|uniref:Pyruvate formate-lyase-activating enzyme n=1 Tax=Caproiciproducens faecalis TaxID=2820301 RepID=A0ABS7DLM9_9FIRM|nr:pyruvate formate-lyase-activating protein [Caproiciproducens faecalis]MBW7572193.1 pyruvate formate lyase-activating protein [Caproiciproducens faecalis]